MSAVLAARERERLRQMELEAQRTAEQLAMLEATSRQRELTRTRRR